MEVEQPKHGFYQQSSLNENGSIASDSPSDFSDKDIMNPNLRELMEQSFKDKYEIMKRAYEERISQLSYVIQETCQALLTDEVIAKMKTDPTTQGYIPSHMLELLNSHVHGERERYVHDLVQRCANLESTNRQSVDRIQVQDRKIRHLESDVAKGRKAEVALDALFNKFGELEVKHEELSSSSSASIQRMETQIADLEEDKETLTTNNENLNNVIAQKGLEIEGLKQANEAQIKEIRGLQAAAEVNARDLAIIEDLDKEEQAVKAALKEQLKSLTNRNQCLTDESHDLKQKIKHQEEDIDRLEDALKASDSAVHEGKQKMQGLMKQVEEMLAQEAQESNAAIAIVHEKMMNLRHKLSTEIAKEKRFSAAQAEELESLRAYKDEKGRELRILQEDEALLREKLNREQQRVQELNLQLQESHAETVSSKKSLEEAEFRARQSLDMLKIVEERLVENEKKFNEELSLAEQRVRVESARDISETVSNLDIRSQSMRLHYQNELGAMQNQLRHSYGGKPSAFPGLAGPAGMIPQPPLTPGYIPGTATGAPSIVHVPTSAVSAGIGGDALAGTLQAEVILKEVKDHWRKEKAQLESAAANHLVKIEALEAELATTKRVSDMSKNNLDEVLETKEKQFQVKLQEMTHKSDMQLRASKESLAEALKMNETLKQTLAEKRHLVEDLQTRLEGAQQALSDHARELTHHRNEHHAHKKSAQDLLQNHQKFVKDAKAAHSGVVEELALTRKAHSDLLEEHEEMRNQLTSLKSRHGNLDEEIQRHKDDKHKLNEIVDEWRRKHEAEKSHKHERIKELESTLNQEKESHNSTRESLSASIGILKKKHESLQLESHNLKEEHRRLRELIEEEEFSHMSNIELLLAMREFYHDLEVYSCALEDKLDMAEINYDTASMKKPHIHHHHDHEMSLSKAVEKALQAKGLDIEFREFKEREKSSPKKGHHHHRHHHHRKSHSDANKGDKEPDTSAVSNIAVDGRSPEELAEHLSKAVARCHTLEGQVRTLSDELESTKSQALLDHEQDSKMITDMKVQFDALMKIHDQQQRHQDGDGATEDKDTEEVEEVYVDEHGHRHHKRHHHHHHHHHRRHHHHDHDKHHHHHDSHDGKGKAEGGASDDAVAASEPVLMLAERSQAEIDQQLAELRAQVEGLSGSLEESKAVLQKKDEELSKMKDELKAAAVVMPEAAAAPSNSVSEEQQQLSLELRQAKEELEATKNALLKAQEGNQIPLRIGYSAKNAPGTGEVDTSASQGALVVADLASSVVGTSQESSAKDEDDTQPQPVSIARGADGVLVATARSPKEGGNVSSPGQKLARVAAFESVCKGLLDALVSNEVLIAAKASELMEDAEMTEQGNVLISSKAQTAVSMALQPFVRSHKDLLKSAAKIETLKQELETTKRNLNDAMESSHDKKSVSTKHSDGHRHHHLPHSFDESVSVDGHSEGSQTAISKAAKELLAGELEQSKQENALLLELTKLEGDARVKTLISKLKATKKAASTALERLRQEKVEALQLMEAKHKAEIDLMKEEIDGLKTTVSAQADSIAEQSAVRSSTLDSKLQLERAKRRDLIKEFEKVDQEHRITIEELENLNLQLEQRCERAELQVTKLRMDAIGKGSDLAGAFESGPHMSTEDNIIMRMFSPPGKGVRKEPSSGGKLSKGTN